MGGHRRGRGEPGGGGQGGRPAKRGPQGAAWPPGHGGAGAWVGSQDWRDRAGHRLRSRVARRGLDTATCHLGIGDVSLEHSVPSTAPGRWNKSVRAHVRRVTVAGGPYWCRGSVRGTARRPACPRVRGPCCRSLTPSGCAPETAPAKRMEREQELESPLRGGPRHPVPRRPQACPPRGPRASSPRDSHCPHLYLLRRNNSQNFNLQLLCKLPPGLIYNS